MPRRAKGQPEFPNRVMVEEDLDSEREVMLSGREVVSCVLVFVQDEKI